MDSVGRRASLGGGNEVACIGWEACSGVLHAPPEVVSKLTAVRIGTFDLVVGKILGGNAFNMMLLMLLDWFYPGTLLGAISRSRILTALATMLTTSVDAPGQLYHEDKRKKL